MTLTIIRRKSSTLLLKEHVYFCARKDAPFRMALTIITVLFGGHAGNTLEIAVEGGRFGEAEHIGRFLKCLCGAGLDEALGLRRHILLYPFARRETASGCADDFAEILRG